jgi:lipopolysaccharide transport system ATP-binding protein
LGESETVIRVDNLSKRYVISRADDKARYATLRDTIARKAKSLFHRLFNRCERAADTGREEFWALKDVSFEVKRGEVVGIIGRNGAGKSTLLKILSRITEPTTGRIAIDGRVASLLEVGTGFHPELTGRENIYLNGSILGMSRAEVKRKFDEIVAFAEIEKFLDTPVKRYSSGMYMRLAFAVAAHLEPEILIVDEVLAVGDAEFQKKCLGKMDEVAKGGRTVMFVSHNIGALLGICNAGVLLDGGKLVLGGDIRTVAAKYTTTNRTQSTLHPGMFRGGLQKSIRFLEIKINGSPATRVEGILPSSPVEVGIVSEMTSPLASFRVTCALFREGVRILSMHDSAIPNRIETGRYESVYVIPPYTLRPGIYDLAIGGRESFSGEWLWGTELAQFTVIEQWDAMCDAEDFGILNLPGRGSRRAFYPETHACPTNLNG